MPGHIRSDDEPEFTALELRRWLSGLGVKTPSIKPESPWEDGHNESFNGRLRDEPLNVEVFHTLLETEVLAERWRRCCSTVRPHTSLGYVPPVPTAASAPAQRLTLGMLPQTGADQLALDGLRDIVGR